MLKGFAPRRAKDAELALKAFRAPVFRALHPGRPTFVCPACRYAGPFMNKGARTDAKCPACGALERTRLHFAVLERILQDIDPASRDILHIAPEPILRRHLRERFRRYRTGDLHRRDVDVVLDIQRLPFANGSFDCVFASHVLEYPADDVAAIAEVRRVLRPRGVAFLPVPLMGECTVDRATRDPVTRVMHEPGLDYFARLEPHFGRVEVIRSDEVDARYQPFVRCPDESVPMPIRASAGVFVDAVPVCYA